MSRVTDMDVEALQGFDRVIEKAEQVRSLYEHPGWQTVERALQQIRIDALERLLFDESKESMDTRKGFAKCINYILNTLHPIQHEGHEALANKEALLQRIQDASLTAREVDATVITHGKGGTVD